MAKSKPEVISLKGEPILKEGQASAAIKPGHLVEFGGGKDIRVQSTAQGDCRRAFALENDLLGKSITDTYATNERVRYGSFHGGQEVLARVAASAPAITKGDALEAASTGTVRKHTTGGAVIGFALEAIDNSTGTKEVFLSMEVK